MPGPRPPLYFDYNAAAPLRPAALAALAELQGRVFGNASSLHAFGREARALLESARETVAEALRASPHEIVFTSGGTEADNLALLGGARAARARDPGRRHLLVSALEHPAVARSAEALKLEGFRVEVLPAEPDGRIAPVTVERALRPETALLSVMTVNHETGVVQDIESIGRLAKERGILFHSDGVQALGKLGALADRFGEADLASFSAHKAGGPKGVGVLLVRKPVLPAALLLGGPQERKLRAGTENGVAIAAFARILEEEGDFAAERERLARYRDAFEAMLLGRLPDIRVNGGSAPRAPGVSNLLFPGCRADLLLMALDFRDLAASAGSACASGSINPSPVLLAMGRSEEEARCSLRFSFGHATAEDEIMDGAERIIEAVLALSA